MRIVVISITYNCADVLPFFLRHYGTIADEIAIWDDQSTDGTREILNNHSKVNLRDWPRPGSGIDEMLFLEFSQGIYPTAHASGFDWVMMPDPDEFLYKPDVRGVLEKAQAEGIDVIPAMGFNMLGEGLPKDDGRQIYEIHKRGMVAPVYGKPIVFRPHIHIRWNRGKHALAECNGKVADKALLKLLHYRYMGGAYTRKRNLQNYSRCGLANGDKGAAWSCSPQWRGEHSVEWAESIKDAGVNVVDE